MLVILLVAGPIWEGQLHYVWSMRPVLGDEGLLGTSISITSIRTPEQGYSEVDALLDDIPLQELLNSPPLSQGCSPEFSA